MSKGFSIRIVVIYGSGDEINEGNNQLNIHVFRHVAFICFVKTTHSLMLRGQGTL